MLNNIFSVLSVCSVRALLLFSVYRPPSTVHSPLHPVLSRRPAIPLICVYLWAILLVLVPSYGLAAETNFNWSFETPAVEAVPVDEPAAAQTNTVSDPAQVVEQADETAVKPAEEAAKKDDGGGFNWAWEKNAASNSAPVVNQQPADVQTDIPKNAKVEDLLPAAQQAPAATGIDADAYNRLVKENLELRGKMDEASKIEEGYKKENAKLSSERADLEKKTAEFAIMISEMKGKVAEIPGGDKKLGDLEEKLAGTEKEKVSLVSSMNALQERINQLEAEKRQIVHTAAASSAASGVAPGSDLFKEKERENLMLKQKLVQIDAERQKILDESKQISQKMSKTKGDTDSAMQKQNDLKKQLAETRESELKHKKALASLLQQMPSLEAKLVELKDESSKKEILLADRDMKVDQMKLELERREYRLAKAERMAKIMEQARDDIRKYGDKEKRDMHYNMATVYSKEGHHVAAEREFLNALRIDPSDADVHYNLAVLYDDCLNDKPKAAMHYRRYITLSPNASDLDQVKTWLMEIEVGGRK